MKKLVLFLFLATALYSCGPSAEEKAKMEQARQDSIKAAEDMKNAAEAAAIAASQQPDSIAKAIADSVK